MDNLPILVCEHLLGAKYSVIWLSYTPRIIETIPGYNDNCLVCKAIREKRAVLGSGTSKEWKDTREFIRSNCGSN